MIVTTVLARASIVTVDGTKRWVFGTDADGNYGANSINDFKRTKSFIDEAQMLDCLTWYKQHGWQTRIIRFPRTYA